LLNAAGLQLSSEALCMLQTENGDMATISLRNGEIGGDHCGTANSSESKRLMSAWVWL